MITEVKIFDSTEFRNTLVEKEKTKNRIENNLIIKNKDKIFESYKTVKIELVSKKEAWKNKTCETCNGNMRFIDGYNFWGCENYKDGNHHPTHGEDYYDNDFDFDFDMSWLLSIKSLISINVKISNLYRFLIANHYEDIRYVIVGRETIIPNFEFVQKRAKEQEDEFYNKTKDVFMKVIQQFGMKITNSDVGRPKKRIADFIASNDSEVFYIEIKNSLTDFNEDQFHETFEGVDYLLKKTSNHKKLYGCLYYFKDKLFELDSKTIINNLQNTAIRIGGNYD